MTDATKSMRLQAVTDELRLLTEVIATMQTDCVGDGARRLEIRPPKSDGDNVLPLRSSVMLPGGLWQTLEALRGAVWAMQRLAKEVEQLGRKHD